MTGGGRGGGRGERGGEGGAPLNCGAAVPRYSPSTLHARGHGRARASAMERCSPPAGVGDGRTQRGDGGRSPNAPAHPRLGEHHSPSRGAAQGARTAGRGSTAQPPGETAPRPPTSLVVAQAGLAPCAAGGWGGGHNPRGSSPLPHTPVVLAPPSSQRPSQPAMTRAEAGGGGEGAGRPPPPAGSTAIPAAPALRPAGAAWSGPRTGRGGPRPPAHLLVAPPPKPDTSRP